MNNVKNNIYFISHKMLLTDIFKSAFHLISDLNPRVFLQFPKIYEVNDLLIPGDFEMEIE